MDSFAISSAAASMASSAYERLTASIEQVSSGNLDAIPELMANETMSKLQMGILRKLMDVQAELNQSTLSILA